MPAQGFIKAKLTVGCKVRELKSVKWTSGVPVSTGNLCIYHQAFIGFILKRGHLPG